MIVGAIVTTVITGLTFAVVLGVLSAGLFFIPLFAALGLAVAFLPSGIAFLVALGSPERYPYAVGAVLAVVLQIGGTKLNAPRVEHEYAQRSSMRTIEPVTRPPAQIAFSCSSMCGDEIAQLLPVTDISIVVVPTNGGKPLRIRKVEAKDCSENNGTEWIPALVTAGIHDWCILRVPADEFKNGVLFREGEVYKTHENSESRGFGAYEVIDGRERVLTRWESDTVMTARLGPFAIFTKPSISTGRPFRNIDVIEAVIGLHPVDLNRPYQRSDPGLDSQWALNWLEDPQLDEASRILARSALAGQAAGGRTANATNPIDWARVARITEKDIREGRPSPVGLFFNADETTRAAFADMFMAIALGEHLDAEVAARLLVETKRIDLSRYAASAEQNFYKTLDSPPKRFTPGVLRFYQEVGSMYVLAGRGDSGARTRMNARVLSLRGEKLLNAALALEYYQRTYHQRTWDWSSAEMTQLIKLSDEFRSVDLLEYIDSLRSTPMGSSHRADLLRHLQSRLQTATEPDDKNAINSLIRRLEAEG